MPTHAPKPTPRQNIEAECARRGREAVIAGCVALLAGAHPADDHPPADRVHPTHPVYPADLADDALVRALGGRAAQRVLEGRDQEYWLRVWAARGLLWAWQDTPATLQALTTATRDESWRVREMAAKVVARNLVGDALPEVSNLLDDAVPRVRAAASRAVVALTQGRI
jgi:HEAT repeats